MPVISANSQTHRASVVAGHFGEWLQGRQGAEGPVCLVTLPCPALCVRPGDAAAPLPPERITGFLRTLGLSGKPPGLTLDMPLGGGAGASTASLVALARGMGFDGPPNVLARACLEAEGATDPLMLRQPDAVLWASREARVIEPLTPPPACTILGGFWGKPQRTDPTDTEFDDVTDLIADWGAATEAQDRARCAAIATESARRCTARRGGGDAMGELARDLGALGVVRAHTGSARGLIFAPNDAPANGKAALTEAGLNRVLTFDTGAP